MRQADAERDGLGGNLAPRNSARFQIDVSLMSKRRDRERLHFDLLHHMPGVNPVVWYGVKAFAWVLAWQPMSQFVCDGSNRLVVARCAM
jgi:hypothetical protein